MHTQTALSTEARAFGSPLDLFRAEVASNPQRSAVLSDRSTLTVGALWHSSTRIAAYLRHAGIEADMRVGLYFEPSTELVQAVWGVLMSGAAYLPLSPDYPDDRIAYMIANAQGRIVLTQPHLEKRLRRLVSAGTRLVSIDDAMAQEPTESVTRSRGSDAAYVIYTSGSTGLPKGVVIEHHSIAHQMNWIASSPTLPAGSRILQKTPFSFDAAQWEILSPAIGSTAVVAAPGAYRDPEAIVEAVRTHEVTALQCVPTLWAALSRTPDFAQCDSLTNLYSGGEVLTVELARRLRQLIPSSRLINLYGPTEATINATSLVVTDLALDRTAEAVPIGNPVGDTELFILDSCMTQMDDDHVGDLYISGPQLARGYLDNPPLTAERFPQWETPDGPKRLYRTGDLARRNRNGSISFVGRLDDQVKINGYRVELDEVRIAIQEHAWITQAFVVPWTNKRTGLESLAAFVELDPVEAALMDQGQHGVHHQSKSSRVQVRAQLAQQAGLGTSDISSAVAISLPGKDASTEQTDFAFQRKTYRFFDGDGLDWARLSATLSEALLEPMAKGPPAPKYPATSLGALGTLLRWFGPFTSPDRLLSKFAYASPGALNATRIYVEVGEMLGLEAGLYYFHPVEHVLVPVRLGGVADGVFRWHLVGRRSAITAVYSTNVDEVLHLEAGHVLGLLDRVLPSYGLGYSHVFPAKTTGVELGDDSTDLLPLCTVEVHAGTDAGIPRPQVDVVVQGHDSSVQGLPAGLTMFDAGTMRRITDDIVRRKDVIAINQAAYERSSFAIALLAARELGWLGFVELGRALQRLQGNDRALGFMSCGYSSLTGHDLLSARRLTAIGCAADKLSYFAIGGPVSGEQQVSRDMREDVVHMRGPAEIIKDDLKRFLPHYMLPSRIQIVDVLPKTANGKCDVPAIRALLLADDPPRIVVAARTPTEQLIVDVWSSALEVDEVSIEDDFFESGGNSLLGVRLINEINARTGGRLPLQTIFEAPTPRGLADAVTETTACGTVLSRLINLSPGSNGDPIYCWPGLGGFPMNLRGLGRTLSDPRRFYAVQAYGINTGESPFRDVQQMAEADVELILVSAGSAPKTLIGYSFGARVAFETAYQLEQKGHEVANLVLVAPGSPLAELTPGSSSRQAAAFDNAYFVRILLSVFTHNIDDERLLAECLASVRNAKSFCVFVQRHLDDLDFDVIARVVEIVRQTFAFKYTLPELNARRLAAPITILRAAGDDYSFVDEVLASSASGSLPRSVELRDNHYSILQGPGLQRLGAAIRDVLDPAQRRPALMPHINIKHFPVSLTNREVTLLTDEISATVSRIFNCSREAISIALEPVDQHEWGPRVYDPEIVERSGLLCKVPDYGTADTKRLQLLTSGS